MSASHRFTKIPTLRLTGTSCPPCNKDEGCIPNSADTEDLQPQTRDRTIQNLPDDCSRKPPLLQETHLEARSLTVS